MNVAIGFILSIQNIKSYIFVVLFFFFFHTTIQGLEHHTHTHARTHTTRVAKYYVPRPVSNANTHGCITVIHCEQ